MTAIDDAALGFAWGEPDASGVAVGLRVPEDQRPHTPGVLRYQIGVRNLGDVPRRVVLMATLDGRVRSRVRVRQGDATIERPAVMPAAPVSARYELAVELAPGELALRDGEPAAVGLHGEATVQYVLGGVAAAPVEIVSGTLAAVLR